MLNFSCFFSILDSVADMMAESETSGASLQPSSKLYGPLSLVVLILCVVVAHVSLLRVPYFWDETYFAPAARDVFLTGKLIPVSVVAESHPPLVYIWLAIWWKLFGFSVLVARIAMLAIAVITLAGVYYLARLLAKGAVPIVVTTLIAVYPVFFTESTFVHLDMAAAGLTLWALVTYIMGRRWTPGLLFALAALAKETAIVAPLAVFVVTIVLAIRSRKQGAEFSIRSAWRAAFSLLPPLLALVFWFAWLHHASGAVFGNSGYVQDNLFGTLHPTRIVLACARHLWHLLGYLNLFVLTGLAAIIFAIGPRALPSRPFGQNSHAWLLLAAVVVGYILMLSVVGAITIARYLLPIYPIIMLALVLAISSRTKWWPVAACLTAAAFVLGLFPYTSRFAFVRDNNLAYLDFVALQQTAAEHISSGNKVRVLTTWPISGELSASWLGYTKQPPEILQIDSFTTQELIAAKENQPQYILMFPRVVCRPKSALFRAQFRHGNYFRDFEELTPDEVAKLMSARVTYYAERNCDWVAVLEVVE